MKIRNELGSEFSSSDDMKALIDRSVNQLSSFENNYTKLYVIHRRRR